MFVATNNSSKRLAAEAEVWMKVNAPWQDVTTAARTGLRAWVATEKGQAAAARGRMATARNIDAMLLDQLNMERKTKRWAAETRHLPKEKLKQKQYRRLGSVPAGRSAVRDVEKRAKGFESPLVNVHFAHGKDVFHSIWLEIAHGGNYSIISKAIAHWTPKFMREIKRIANLVQYQGQLVISDEIQTQEEMFAEHVRKENIYLKGEGRKPYEGWTVARQQNRARNRARFGTEESKTKRKAARAEKKVYLSLLSSR